MVAIRCICPPKADGEPRHESDEVVLRPRLDFLSAITIRNALAVMYVEDPEADVPEILGVLSERYLLHGIESWSIVDADGRPVPPTKGNIREILLTSYEEARAVADAADALYQEQVMLPLLGMASTSSPPTPTDGSTSAPSGSPSPSPTPSSPSSISTIPTDATARTTSARGGDSKSSQKSRSVA